MLKTEQRQVLAQRESVEQSVRKMTWITAGEGQSIRSKRNPGVTPAKNKKGLRFRKPLIYWWPEAESNRRHADFQYLAGMIFMFPACSTTFCKSVGYRQCFVSRVLAASRILCNFLCPITQELHNDTHGLPPCRSSLTRHKANCLRSKMRRAQRTDLPMHRAFCLCGPDFGLPVILLYLML
jgi:hypothetical protein